MVNRTTTSLVSVPDSFRTLEEANSYLRDFHRDLEYNLSQQDIGGYKYRIHGGGRLQFNTDLRWVTDSDDFYGPQAEVMSEYGGTGTTPVAEWEHLGFFLPSGSKITNLRVMGRANSAEVTDMQVYAVIKYPDPITGWDTGVDNDAEDAEDVILNDKFKTTVSGLRTLTGDMDDLMKQEWSFNKTIGQDSFLSLYFKPEGTLTAVRYYALSYVWEVE